MRPDESAMWLLRQSPKAGAMLALLSGSILSGAIAYAEEAGIQSTSDSSGEVPSEATSGQVEGEEGDTRAETYLEDPALSPAQEEGAVMTIASWFFGPDADGDTLARIPAWRRDERFTGWQAPETIEEAARRFLPTYIAQPQGGEGALFRTGIQIEAIEVVEGVCYGLVAIGENGSDLDVDIFRGQHFLAVNQVAQDAFLGAHVVAQWCANRSGSVQARFHMYEAEEGSRAAFQWQLYAEHRSLVSALGERDELSNRLLAAQSRSVPGWGSTELQWRHQFSNIGEHQVEVEAVAGACFAIIGVGELGVDDLDLELRDSEARLLASDFSLDRDAALVHCPERDETLLLTFLVSQGHGMVAAQRFFYDVNVAPSFGAAAEVDGNSP